MVDLSHISNEELEMIASQQRQKKLEGMSADELQKIARQTEKRQTLSDRIVGNPITQGILGAGDTVQRHLVNAANLMPGANFQAKQYGDPERTSYKVGEVLGNIGEFAAAGAPAMAAIRGAQAIPYIGRGAQYLAEGGGMADALRRIAGTAAYGAATEQDRGKAALMGGGLQTAAETIPLIGKGIGAITSFMRPTKLVKDMLKSAPKQLSAVEKTGNDTYRSIFDSVGDSWIFDRKLNQSLSKSKDISKQGTFPAFESEYLSIKPHELKRTFNSDVKKLHERFLENPTFKNAHELQSQMGTEIRDLEAKKALTKALDQKERNVLISYKEAQKRLQKDMGSFLEKTDPSLVDKYVKAQQYWASEVIPNKNLKYLTQKLGNNPTPDKTLKAIESAEKKGISLPNGMVDFADTLRSRIGYKRLAQTGAGLLAGAALGSEVSASPLTEMLIAAMGAGVTPSLMKSGGGKIGNIGEALAKAYQPVSKGIISNVLNQQRGQ